MKKKVIFSIATTIILILVSVFVMIKMWGTAIGKKSEKLYSGVSVTVIIGGVNSDPSYIKALQSAFPESVLVIPKKYFPLSEGAEDMFRQIRGMGINGPIRVIAHSISGLLARQIDAMNPGLVKEIVTIGTPHFGSFKWMPQFVSDNFLRPGDERSKTPLYVIGGFVQDEEIRPVELFSIRRGLINTISDGTVDLPAVMDLGKREVKAFAVFPIEHTELVSDREVIKQIKIWLEPEIKVAAKAASK